MGAALILLVPAGLALFVRPVRQVREARPPEAPAVRMFALAAPAPPAVPPAPAPAPAKAAASPAPAPAPRRRSPTETSDSAARRAMADPGPAAAVPTLAPVSPAPAPSPKSAPAPDPVPAAPPAAVRDRYADALWRHIAAHRPRGIRLSGEAQVGFTVDRSGAVTEIAIGRSSGNLMLDRLALRTVHRAAPMPVPPDALGKGPFRFTITVTFE